MIDEELDPRYLLRKSGAPAPFLLADPGSRLRRIPGTGIYFKWIDFELWRRIAAWVKRGR